MRIISFFVRSLFLLGILATAIYFLGGQLWMSVRLGRFITEMKTVETSRANAATYTRRCQSAPASSSLSKPIAVQLRFLDATHYQTELRCTLIEESPIILQSGELPMFISKVPGSSGLYVDLNSPTTSSVTFKSFAATKTFSLNTAAQHVDGQTSVVTNPATSCTGWGYQCCDPISQQGSEANQRDGVTDCSQNCFAACRPIPYIQAFTTDPYPTNGNTVVMPSSTLTVTFSYTAVHLGGEIASVHIDYGDGHSDDSSEVAGAFVHDYACTGACSNTATITATDTRGNSSVVNESTKLYIKRE